MIASIEQKALAYVNMYGVLGSLENLCAMDDEAIQVLSELEEPVSLCFSVVGEGPTATLNFTRSGCKLTEGSEGCTMKMTFATPALFNKLISSSIPGVPTKDPVGTMKFLMGPFTILTDRLNDVLRPTPEALKDRAFFEENTLMTMYVIAGAVSALANYDSISKISAGATDDGDIQLSIEGYADVTFRVHDHRFTTIKSASPSPRATMSFADIDLANGLFTGQVSTMNEMCKGTLKLAGMANMLDNVNRILDRVAVYLA